MQPPNDVRNFVHKRIGRAFTGFVSSGFNPLSALGGFMGSRLRPLDVPTSGASPRSLPPVPRVLGAPKAVGASETSA